MLHFVFLDEEDDLQGITLEGLLPTPDVKGQFLQRDASQDLDIVLGLTVVREGIVVCGLQSAYWGPFRWELKCGAFYCMFLLSATKPPNSGT